MRTRILALLASLGSLTPVTAQQQPPAPVPAEIIHRIAVATAGETSVPLQEEKVSLWLDTIGGPTWYANYRKQFGSPEARDFASPGDYQSPSLDDYYMRMPGPAGFGVHLACSSLDKQQKGHRTVQGFCALANWNAFNDTADMEYRAAFIRWANELNDSADDGRWIWTLPIPAFGISTPWISGLTQGVAISVLLRAHQLTGEVKYLATARRAMAWLSKPISEGGCLSVNKSGTWIEEYPNAADPNHVFNGHLWALFGVWDYYRATKDEAAKGLFNEGVRVIKAEIDRYDTGSWVVYSQKNNQDNVIGPYMQFIIEQMKIMARITGDKFFATYAEKWGAYQNNDALFVKMGIEEFEKANQSAIAGH